jgi:hypothetical protein
MKFGSRAIFSIPIARSNSSHCWPVAASDMYLQGLVIGWLTFAGTGRGFTHKMVPIKAPSANPIVMLKLSHGLSAANPF